MALSKEDLIEEIKTMSVLDLAEVVKALEEEFGVSAAAPVVMLMVQRLRKKMNSMLCLRILGRIKFPLLKLFVS